MVADVNHFDVFIGSGQKQVQQNIKTLGYVFGGLIHRTGHIHQTEHHRFAGRNRTFFEVSESQVKGINKRHTLDSAFQFRDFLFDFVDFQLDGRVYLL